MNFRCFANNLQNIQITTESMIVGAIHLGRSFLLYKDIRQQLVQSPNRCDLQMDLVLQMPK
jgi:NADH/NAD ratio-sensing transcriptional regulator Rex